MILNVGMSAFASTETLTESERRHPDKTGDEALLYDYLAGDLMHLTECPETFNFLYDGLPVSFPPSDVPYRPEQIAVLMLGVIPRDWAEVAYDRAIPTEAVGYVYGSTVDAVEPPGLFNRMWNWLTGTISPLSALPQSGHITNHGYVTAGTQGTSGGRYTITIDGVEIPAFCNNRNIPGPATGASHRLMGLANEQTLRALYFGWGGPSNIFGPGQMAEGVLATTVVTSYIAGHTGSPASHNLQGSRDLWARVQNTAEFPMRHNVQGIFIDVLAAGSQNLVAIRVIPDTPPVTPPPTTPPTPPPDEGALRIIKTSDSGNIQGIQFRVTGTGIDQIVTTGAGGVINIPGLSPGAVLTITEQNLGSEYEPQPPQTVTVIANQTVEVRFHNRLRPPAPGTLRIVKTSESGNVAGIQFRITGDGINQTVTTGTDGTIAVPDLQAGLSLTVNEINLEAQYVRPQSQTVTIRSNETVSVTFHNQLLRGSVSGLKVGEDFMTFRDASGLAGAVIGLFPVNTAVFTEATALAVTVSGAGGVFSFDDLLYGYYLIGELATGSAAYLLNEEVFPIRISSDGQIVPITLTNELLRGRIEGHKVGETTIGMLTGIFEDADGLEGVTIGIFAPDTEIFSEETALEVVITDQYGRFSFEMPYGYFLIRELSTGSDAYVLSEETIPVRIDTDGQIIEIQLENRLALGGIRGMKTGETTEGLLAGMFSDREGLAGATIGLFGLVELGIAQPEDDTGEESEYPAEDEQEAELIPASDAEDNYADYDEEDDPDEEESEQIILSISGIPLEDFAFTSETAAQTVISAEDGSFAFEDAIMGHWVVREVYAPESYVLNETLFLVEITEDGHVVYVEEISNTLIRGDIEGLKIGQDTVYPFEGMITDGTGLAGAVIGLFREDTEEFTEETAVQIAISDERGYFTFQDVIFGSWIVREIASGNPAYTLNSTSFPITIAEDGQVIEIVIENELIFGDIRGIKVNAAATDEVLEGAIFGLFHEGEAELTRENALMIAASAEDGTFSLAGIPFGVVLQLAELYAPEGFLRSDEVILIEITEADQVIELVIENEPEPDAPEDEDDEPEDEDDEPDKGTPDQPNQPPRAPQTGDDTQLPWLTLVLSLIGMLSLIGGAVWYKRRRAIKNDEAGV